MIADSFSVREDLSDSDSDLEDDMMVGEDEEEDILSEDKTDQVYGLNRKTKELGTVKE